MEENKDEFKLVGLKLDNKTTNHNNQSSINCGNLWQRFEAEKVFDRLIEKLTQETYAVYYDYESDETGPFSYFIGCKVVLDAAVPEGLADLIVPSQDYRKYIAKGKMTGCITNEWKKIWESDVNRKFGFDFEVYDERSLDWNDAEVDIFISI